MRALEGLRVRRVRGGRGSGAEIEERGDVSRTGRERGRKRMEVGKRWIGVRQGPDRRKTIRVYRGVGTSVT